MSIDNEFYRGGSARWLDERDYRDAGMYRQSDDAIYLGKDDKGRNLFYNDAACGLICAGSRSNKGAGIIVPNLINNYSKRTKIVYSWKPDLAMICRDQVTHLGRKTLTIAPTPVYDSPQDRINPLSHLHINSPTLEGDIKAKCQSFLPESDGSNAKYFELTGQRFNGGIDLALVERDGVLTFPAIYDAMLRIQQDDDAWEEIAYFMRNSRFPAARAVEAEIRHGKQSSSNSFYGVVSEVQNAYDAFSDSALMASVSPPYTATWQDVIADGNYTVFFCYDANLANTYGRVARTNLATIKTIKERLPDANGIDIWADESPKLAPLSLADELVSFSPGMGIRSIWVFQAYMQMANLLKHGEKILPASCGFQLYFGQREIDDATRVSKILGEESLYFDDGQKQAEADYRARQAVRELMQGGDPLAAGMKFDHYQEQSGQRSQMSRFLQKPDEVMRLPKGKAYLKIDQGTGITNIPGYFTSREQAGKYLPDPFHSPLDKVKVKTLFGHKWLPVKRGAPPSEYADYPQFQGHDHVYVGKA